MSLISAMPSRIGTATSSVWLILKVGSGPVLRAILQIAAHEPATRAKLRTVIERFLPGQARAGLTEPERLTRSSLIASQLLGLAFMRYISKIEPLATMAEEDLAAAIAPSGP